MENIAISLNFKPPASIIPSQDFKRLDLPPKSFKSTVSFSKQRGLKFPDSHLDNLCRNGRLSEAVVALDSIAERGLKVKPSTYINLLQSCIDTNSVQLGRKLHSRMDVVERINPFVETKLVSMYAKCGYLEDARHVFDGMRKRNLFTWSAMIGACSREQRWKEVVELFFLMMGDGVIPDQFLFPKIVQACGKSRNFAATKLIHSVVVRCGFSHIRVNNSILAAYAKCGKLDWAKKFFENMDERDGVTWNAMISGYCQEIQIEEAQKLFDAMSEKGTEPGLVTWNILIDSYSQLGQSEVAVGLMKKMESLGIAPDVFTWTCLISGFAHNNRRNQALDLFKEMLMLGAKPNGITMTSVISTCASLKSLNKGREIHPFAIKIGLMDDVLVGNSLVDMYSKCGELEAAQEVFDSMVEKDVYTWNSIIGGYCQAGYCGKAYELFMKMQESDVPPNVVTWNVMISGYIQNGDEDEAMDIFHRMENNGKIKRNTASWNSLISGYFQLGEIDKGLGIFRQMQSFSVSPNSVTILSVLPACANLVAAKKIREIHCCVLRRNLESELPVANSLVDTYVKSGNLMYSRTVFNGMSSKDMITWNSIIGGYVLHGRSDDALDLFDHMKKFGFKPNRGTFASILYAYSLSGLLDEGKRAFSSITEDYDIVPGLEHYSAMVDLLGRSGRLREAMEFIEEMPVEPDYSVWAALLTACRIHRNIALAVRALDHVLELEPGNYLIQSLMLQAYALARKSEIDSKLRKLEKENAGKRHLGECWIELGNKVYTFTAGDQSKPCLYPRLREITEKVKNSDLYDGVYFEEEEREDACGVHSEKIAMAFALISFPSQAQTVRMIKNLRMCRHCHETAKYISKAYKCEIYLSDTKCLHHFSSGHCSCGDYW